MHKTMWVICRYFSLGTWFHLSTNQRLQINAAFANHTVKFLLKKDDGTGLPRQELVPVRSAESWNWPGDGIIINVGIIINTHLTVENELHPLPVSCILTWIIHHSLLALTQKLLEMIIGIGLQVRSFAQGHFVPTVTYRYFYLTDEEIKLSRPEAASQLSAETSFGTRAPAR